MSGGYRESPEEANRRRMDRFELAVGVVSAFGFLLVIEFFDVAIEELVGQTALARAVFVFVAGILMMWPVARWLKWRRTREQESH